MNVLYLTYDGLNDPLGQSQIIPYINIIKNLDNKVFIISFEKEINLNKKYCLSHKILKFKNKRNLFTKIYDLICLFITSLVLCKTKKITVIHARSHICCFIAFIISYFFKIKIIFDFRGLWIDERFEMGLWKHSKLNNFFYKMLKKLEIKLISHSDELIVLTKSIREKFKRYNKKISVIPCIVDYKFFQLKNLNTKKKIYLKYKLNSKKKTICYMGSLGGIYDTKEILYFFKKIKNILNDIQILVVTNNPEEIKNIQKKYFFLRQIQIKVFKLKKKNIPEILNCVDYAFNFIKNGNGRIAQSPTRVSEFLSMGIPVLSSNKIGDLEELFLKNNFGKIFNNCNNLKYNNMMQFFYPKVNYNKNLIRKKSKLFFDISIANNKYLEIYERIK